MPERFLGADWHFGHQNILQFGHEDGTPLRPWGRYCPDRDMPEAEKAERVEAMNEALVERWNAVVGPKDKVYLLGDIVFGRLDILGRLNGKLRLSGKGNHDKRPLKDYAKYFEEIDGVRELTFAGKPNLILSHIPLHPVEVSERWDVNVHGHLHAKRVMKTIPDISGYGGTRLESTYMVTDPLYLCVSIEHTNFAPIALDEVYQRIAQQQEEYKGVVNA